MEIAIHILNLDAKIEFEKDGHVIYLPACSVIKIDDTSVILIDGEEYDVAILIDIAVTYKLAKILGTSFEELLNEIVIHELCHIFNPDWEHDFEVWINDLGKHDVVKDLIESEVVDSDA